MSGFKFGFFEAEEGDEAASAPPAASSPSNAGAAVATVGATAAATATNGPSTPGNSPGPRLLQARVLSAEELLATAEPAADAWFPVTCVDAAATKLELVQARDLELAAGPTDVERGVYEGGLKLWECSQDLVGYLAEHPSLLAPDAHVMDLGCGHGLPGLFVALRCPSASVCFQDLNAEVLLRQTLHNVRRNTGLSAAAAVAQHSYVSGDWTDLQRGLDGVAVADLIVTSETVYHVESYGALHGVLERYLRPTTGVVLVAAKRYYFGVGGGSTSFCDFVDARGVFAHRKVAEFQDGASNVRDLVELRWLTSGPV